jgi:hypothetical protein
MCYSNPVKKCSTCKTFKNRDTFSKNRRNSDGLDNRCKECVLIAQRKRRATSKGRAKMRKWARERYYRDKQNRPDLIQKKYAYRRQYGREHKEVLNAYSLAYINKRKKEDINFHLKDILRKRLWAAIKHTKKISSAVKDLGCSIWKLKIYLQLKFHRNPENNQMMTWENYGQWHIDHIKPLASFDLTDRTQFLQACHYTNLQPLWAKQNLKKADKV